MTKKMTRLKIINATMVINLIKIGSSVDFVKLRNCSKLGDQTFDPKQPTTEIVNKN